MALTREARIEANLSINRPAMKLTSARLPSMMPAGAAAQTEEGYGFVAVAPGRWLAGRCGHDAALGFRPCRLGEPLVPAHPAAGADPDASFALLTEELALEPSSCCLRGVISPRRVRYRLGRSGCR